MTKKEYCNHLLRYRKDGFSIIKFLGGRWIILKVVILAFGIFLLTRNNTFQQVFGGMMIGYALGKIAAGIMTYRTAKKGWVVAENFINWDKVEGTAQDIGLEEK